MAGPVPADLVRVNIVHKIADGPEVVSNSFHLKLVRDGANAFSWPAITQRAAELVRDKYLAAGCMQRLANVTVLERVKAYHLDAATGLAIHEGDAIAGAPGVGVAGSGGASPLPFDVSLVCSLRTDVAGEVLLNPKSGPSPTKRSRGRMYLGVLPSNIMGANGRFSQLELTAISNVWQNFLNDVHGMGTDEEGVDAGSWRLVVLSKAAVATRDVTEIVFDDLPDTQRRRSNRQLPTRTRRPIAGN